MTTLRHVSSFELDVYFASRDQTTGASETSSPIGQHLAECAACAAYLAELEALDREGSLRVPRPGPTVREPAPVAWLSGKGRWLASAATLGALAAAVLVYVKSPPPHDPRYIGVKGMPAVQMLVRSQGATRVWDGRSTVRAGDSLAVHVACERLEYVTVASRSSSRLVRLSDGPCPEQPATLPFTLVVDDEPGPEHVLVVMSRSRLEDAALAEAVRAPTEDGSVWVAAFDFAKEAQR